MFNRAKTQTRLEAATDRALIELENLDVASEEYANVLEKISKLYEISATEKPNRLSADTIAITAANILGIILVIHHENVNVITSRAMNLVMKPK